MGEIPIPCAGSEVTLPSFSRELRGYIMMSRPHELTVMAPSPDAIKGDSISDLKAKARDVAPGPQAS